MTATTTDIDVTLLPARPPLDGEFGPVPAIDEIREGDLVAIYSRGAVRVAMVEKIGRTNLGCVYTTKGAWDTAAKIHESHSNRSRIQTLVDYAAKAAAKNFDFYVGESDAATAKYAVATSWWSEDQAEAERAEYRERIAVGKDAYVAAEVEKARATATAEYETAIEVGVAGYVHVTRKNVKLDDVEGWKRVAA